jgi:polyribonucleotide 5'-hydroxyl-kinase
MLVSVFLFIILIHQIINNYVFNPIKALVSGIIINTSGWIRDEGYAAIRHAATEFDVNMILVIDQERLRVDLIRDLPESIKILSIPKSGGVVTKSQEIRTQFKTSKMREYFYGFKSNLYPHNIEVKFNDVKVYKVGAPQMSEGLLPMGMNPEENYTKIYKIQPCEWLNINIFGYFLILFDFKLTDYCIIY